MFQSAVTMDNESEDEDDSTERRLPYPETESQTDDEEEREYSTEIIEGVRCLRKYHVVIPPETPAEDESNGNANETHEHNVNANETQDEDNPHSYLTLYNTAALTRTLWVKSSLNLHGERGETDRLNLSTKITPGGTQHKDGNITHVRK